MGWLSETANSVVFFLWISLVTSNWTLSYSELAARHRLLWLRQGGDREAHWQKLRGFTGIDWNQVRPSLNHSNGLPDSIWAR